MVYIRTRFILRKHTNYHLTEKKVYAYVTVGVTVGGEQEHETHFTF